ncbi:MAG TPA: hypothetical protein VFC51_17750 [Chloroflexota bacterium]|nr:hypothetical protein [Chloroflexota bacterium]
MRPGELRATIENFREADLSRIHLRPARPLWRTTARGAIAFALALWLRDGPTARAADRTPIFVSGYEVSAGRACVVAGLAGNCGVTFGGWIGGAGPVSNGWAAFRGGPIAWVVIVNYSGAAGLGHAVVINEGTWTLSTGSATLNGQLSQGAVTWPADASADLGCGKGVALVTAALLTSRSQVGSVSACLDDTHLATVFPPRLWGGLALPPPSGLNLNLRADRSGSTTLSWTNIPGTLSYVIVRLDSTGPTLLPSDAALPASATGFTDVAPPTGLDCYVVFAIGAAAVLAGSDLLCGVPGSHSGALPPGEPTIQLGQSTIATLTWISPATVDSISGYALVPFSGDPSVLPASARATSTQMGGPSCFVIASLTESGVGGTSDVVCAWPGFPSVAATDSGLRQASGPSLAR